MKHVLSSLLLIFCASFSYAQDATVYELSKFKELIVIGNFPVEVLQSDRKEVVVKKDNQEVNLDHLSFSYSNNKLTIKYSGSFVDEIGIQLSIYHPNPILLVEARRGAQIKLREVGEITSTVTYKSDAGGKLVVDKVNSPLIKAIVTKGGSIHLSGEGQIFEPTVKTGGTIASVNLKAKEVNASITFGGEILCSPVDILNAKVTSGGTINYTGAPEVNKEIKITGTVEKI